jgi:cell division topological specificity factor
MMNFLFGRKKSANSAKERLQLVLIHDRTDLSPVELESLKDDLIETISRHIDIDPTAVKINVAQDGRSQRLVADIPLRSVGRKRGRESRSAAG